MDGLEAKLMPLGVGLPDTRYHKAVDPLESSTQGLTMQLFPSHYTKGQLVLKCTAHIGALYRRSVEVRLNNRGRDPVPERVTSPNTTPRLCAPLPVLLILAVLCCQIAR
uniref:Uncharacterized protein n=1 Tax=Timema monikensis TaxID=170555 RepID=A0A7R9EDZ6_9NEOP|nr:unnamed protein product [Timema monikensis]